VDILISGTAKRLREAGIHAGSLVGIRMNNDWRYLVVLFALFRIRAVACPISPRFAIQTVSSALAYLNCHRLISTTKDTFGLSGLILAVDDLIEVGEPCTSFFSLDQSATVIFTSGSTNVPKAALHAIRQHYFSAIGANTNMTLGAGDRWLLSLPLYHVGGLAIPFRCWLAGASVVVTGADMSTGQAILDFGITHVSMVATQLRRYLDAGAMTGQNSLKAILLGGSEIPTELLLRSGHLPVHTTYGLTEMASQVTTGLCRKSEIKNHTSGKLLPHRALRIDDNGEILVCGKTLFEGYLRPEGCDPARDSDGWFHTRDLGKWGADSRLIIVGRIDNMFISGGENVHPEEIERALLHIPQVLRAVVVPVPDVAFGMRPVAFIKTTGRSVSSEEMSRELGGVLPNFKIPVAYYPWPEIGEDGKPQVDRTKLKSLGARLHQLPVRSS